MTTPRWRKWLGALALFGVGILIGAAGAFLQAERFVVGTPWGREAVPWGLVFVWVVLVVAVRGGAWALWSRWGAWAVAAGWLASTVVLAAESPSGDLALSGGGRQMTYLLGGVILASAAATFPVPRREIPAEADISDHNEGNPENAGSV
ncbi:MAG: hypothetical protein GC156_08140 [Actinomycetales bacterium]|nr:hypothetical protein [Actinomycetales bacterium]